MANRIPFAGWRGEYAARGVNLSIAISLKRDPLTVAVVRGVTGDILRRIGVSPDCVDDLQLALSEACTNVIDHAPSSDEYEVRLDLDHERCTVQVIDSGRDGEITAMSAVLPDESSARGRGIAIMRSVTDNVEFTCEAGQGTVTRFDKRVRFEASSRPWAFGQQERAHGRG